MDAYGPHVPPIRRTGRATRRAPRRPVRARGPAGSARRGCPAARRRRVASARRGTTVPSPSAVHTVITGSVSCRWNAFCSAMTSVDSALRGRNAAWSSVATSPSRPAKGPRAPPTQSRTRTVSRTGTRRRTRRTGNDITLQALRRGRPEPAGDDRRPHVRRYGMPPLLPPAGHRMRPEITGRREGRLPVGVARPARDRIRPPTRDGRMRGGRTRGGRTRWRGRSSVRAWCRVTGRGAG